jgi:hypothetical protein
MGQKVRNDHFATFRMSGWQANPAFNSFQGVKVRPKQSQRGGPAPRYKDHSPDHSRTHSIRAHGKRGVPFFAIALIIVLVMVIAYSLMS